MLAALFCGLGLPTPHAREPLFASTVSAVERESRGKDGGAAAEITELRIPLVAGWNRISWNVQLPRSQLLSEGQDKALLDAVVELRGFKPGKSVAGTISTDLMKAVDGSQGYKLKMANGPHELVLSGPPADVCTTIPLTKGVAWIPYLLQDDYAHISGTVSPLRRTEGGWATGDQIKDETSGTFTTYYAGHGWWGTLETLRAGRMYVVTSAEEGILTYAGKGEWV